MRAVAILAVLLLPAIAWASPSDRAAVLIDAVPDAARAAMVSPLDDPDRLLWRWTPGRRGGATMAEIGTDQHDLVWDLLASVLSEEGLRRARGAVALERVLGEITDNPGFRDPGRYTLAIFGDPSPTDPWAFRFEGHHLSINVSLTGDLVLSVTPTFIGANPAMAPDGTRLLERQADIARALHATLTADQFDAADQGYRAGDLAGGAAGIDHGLEAAGLPADQLTEDQRGLLRLLVADHTGVTRAPPAATGDLTLQVHPLPGGFYYRITGPALLIESHAKSGNNHVHAVWRDRLTDFGGPAFPEAYR